MATNVTNTKVQTTTILSGTNVSAVVDCGMGYVPIGLEIPATWDTADIIIQGTNTRNADGTYGTFKTLVDIGGKALRVAGVTVSTAISLTGLDRPNWRYLKFLSVTVGLASAVNQTADRVLTVNTCTL